MTTTEPLPRLLYLGDVPVESSYHGSALLYRLLQDYPPDKLLIIEGNLRNSLPERRLPAVSYAAVTVGWARPLRTRFSHWAHLAYSFAAGGKVGAVERAMGDFQPEAVLTVAHEFLWLTAARLARKNALPLHLICHDDWPSLAPLPSVFRRWLERKFANVYRQSSSRLCVSPYMAEEYERRYGVGGTVLYPSRGPQTPFFEAADANPVSGQRPFTVAYAGNLVNPDYVRQLSLISRMLADLGGRLLLFGPFDDQMLRAAGMDMANVIAGGMLTSPELIGRLHRDADVLFLPMSFAASEQEIMALNFPSKLTDYTAAARPLLIWGPASCSAAQWAAKEPGVAAILSTSEPGTMAAMLKKLQENPAWRRELAAQAVIIGKKYFGPTAANEVFLSSLTRSASVTNGQMTPGRGSTKDKVALTD